MGHLKILFRGETLQARRSGALFWPARKLLCVSDLHLGKSERMARRGGPMLPPYEGIDTLDRLDAEIAATGARRVVCLGDSFDDMDAAAALDGETRARLVPLMAGVEWIWIAGNHDPGPMEFGGSHRAEYGAGALTFRHVPDFYKSGEVAGHFHPKARIAVQGRTLSRPCFLIDELRIVMPAFGTYTGGLNCDAPELQKLMEPDARAILLGDPPVAVPMPRPNRSARQSPPRLHPRRP